MYGYQHWHLFYLPLCGVFLFERSTRFYQQPLPDYFQYRKQLDFVVFSRKSASMGPPVQPIFGSLHNWGYILFCMAVRPDDFCPLVLEFDYLYLFVSILSGVFNRHAGIDCLHEKISRPVLKNRRTNQLSQ